MSLLSRAVAKIKDALVFLSQKAAGIGQENQIKEVIHDQAGAGMLSAYSPLRSYFRGLMREPVSRI